MNEVEALQERVRTLELENALFKLTASSTCPLPLPPHWFAAASSLRRRVPEVDLRVVDAMSSSLLATSILRTGVPLHVLCIDAVASRREHVNEQASLANQSAATPVACISVLGVSTVEEGLAVVQGGAPCDVVLLDAELVEPRSVSLLRRQLSDLVPIVVVVDTVHVAEARLKAMLTLDVDVLLMHPLTTSIVAVLWQHRVRRDPLFIERDERSTRVQTVPELTPSGPKCLGESSQGSSAQSRLLSAGEFVSRGGRPYPDVTDDEESVCRQQ